MKDDVLDAAPSSGARFERGTEIERLVATFAELFYRIDVDIDTLRRSRYAETADSVELNRIGREVGVQRPVGENDDEFRRRVLAGRKRATSTTTWDDFAEVAMDVLDADETEIQLKVDYDDELGAVIVLVKSTILNNAPFSQSQIVEFLEETIPMDRRVVIRETDVATWDDPSKGWDTPWGSDVSS